jgi:UDP-N-acetylmuramoylalanine-D-glutamate ligase
MGCNTSKEAVLSVEDSKTGASCDQQQSEEKKGKIFNNAVNTIPEIGK